MRRSAVLLILTLVLGACSGEKAKPLSEPGEKLFTLQGKIVARDAADNTLRVDHHAITGFMEAMTMDYSVRGAKVTEMPPDGTSIEGKLHVTEKAYWLTDVKKVP